MLYLGVFVVVLGVCSASPAVFLQNTPEVQAATNAFIREYNRLAKLAADAPDIDVYDDDSRLQRIDFIPIQRVPQPLAPLRPLTTVQRVPQPLAPVRPSTPVQQPGPIRPAKGFSFTADLGGGGSHFFTNQIPSPFLQPAFLVSPDPFATRWRGPMADTVPAGVLGLPRQVKDTPEVAAAKAAHLRILDEAYRAASFRSRTNSL